MSAAVDPAALLRERFGVEPDGVWAAPGRVNLVGEHTDYNAGLCLPTALPMRTRAAVRRRGDDVLRLVSAQEEHPWTGRVGDIAPGGVGGWAAYVAGVVWALRGQGADLAGLDVAVDSDVPVGAGLSSSAALECSVALAAAELAGLPTDDEGRARLAAACVRAENEVAGAPTGGMDQAASLRCRADHALLLDCRDGSVEHVPLDLAAAGLTLLVIDTRAPHRLVDGQYAARRAACERAAAVLGVSSLREVDDLDAALGLLPGDGLRRVVRHVVTEIGRVRDVAALLRAGRAADAGPLLDASHASLRDDYEVSCPELDTAVSAALSAGALGARMTGGGFGGSAIALVRSGDADGVGAAVRAAFARSGFAAPAVLTASPSEGAVRVL
ncbi:galactokinase [Actinorugispora endophytica]|uniref:Galactokinase n=1 Tax=Actinorugispora endophytica TaxID=1605990 RepID=A0A4R6V5S2_9ACTN|nr:galactokinase [Actinorugispora endophytica]TDQ54185.1 galactokinase [Actinorugispora endophytica]